MEVSIVKKVVFNCFWPFLLNNEWIWWPIQYLFGVMSVVGTLGDTIG
jgi:hypothetical protein